MGRARSWCRSVLPTANGIAVHTWGVGGMIDRVSGAGSTRTGLAQPPLGLGAWFLLVFVVASLVVVVGQAAASAAPLSASARGSSATEDVLCNTPGVFPDANERSVGNTTYLNRQLSVE